MILHQLSLEGFRNYDSLSTQFDPGINLIYGDNAQGKTNLLEAVHYLSGCRSHRARSDRELIGFDRTSARLTAHLTSHERDFKLEAILRRGGKRTLFSNGVRLKSAVELSGILNTVLFCPEDLSLIRDGAAQRRRFLDTAICQLRPRYAAALGEYHRLYEHKTRILRDWQENPSLLDTLDDFNERMAEVGSILIHYRAHYVRRLREFAAPIHREFSGGREELDVVYQTVSTISDPLAKPGELLPLLRAHQAAHREAEIASRSCLSGPHKDELEVAINGIYARQFGSQGQTRTAALSLKLAEREISRDDTGQWPVLLLDDVLSELDVRRQEFVLNRIRGGQVFLTCCEEERLTRLKNGKTFHIQNGMILPE